METAISTDDSGELDQDGDAVDFIDPDVVTYCDQLPDIRMRHAMLALAQGCTRTEAAVRLGVSRMMIWRWIQDYPDFEQMARREALAASHHAIFRLAANADQAAKVITDHVQGKFKTFKTAEGIDVVDAEAARLQQAAARVNLAIVEKLLEKVTELKGIARSSHAKKLNAANAVEAAKRLGKR